MKEENKMNDANMMGKMVLSNGQGMNRHGERNE